MPLPRGYEKSGNTPGYSVGELFSEKLPGAALAAIRIAGKTTPPEDASWPALSSWQGGERRQERGDVKKEGLCRLTDR